MKARCSFQPGAAHESLRHAGLPTYARVRALSITGPDAASRLAAGSEWHLQLVHALTHEASPYYATKLDYLTTRLRYYYTMIYCVRESIVV